GEAAGGSPPGPVPGRIQRAGPPTALVHPRVSATGRHPAPTAVPPAGGVDASPAGQAPVAAPVAPAGTPAVGSGQADRDRPNRGRTDRDEANPASWQEYGRSMRAAAGAAVFEMWAIDPQVQRRALGLEATGDGSESGSGTAGSGSGGGSGTGSGGGSGTGSGGGAGAGHRAGSTSGHSGPTGSVGTGYDRFRRREELRQQALALLNADVPAGGAEITDLSDEQRAQIERQLDEEEAAAAGTAPESVRTWGEFAGDLRYGLAELATNPWGVELAAEEVRALRGRTTGGAAGAGAVPAEHRTAPAGTGSGTPGRPVADSGRPLVEADDLDLDDLAGRLYDRLRSRLRLELLLDRERAGLLTDFR
ncbi:hypothetical protein ACNTMW_33910, partial [Planosporangium sp. 12N6]